MKKLNNKGFAISTVIYGLSIMGILLVAILMATMASTRSNSRQLAKSIEEELNRFSKTETFFSPKVESGDAALPAAQEYIVPTAGWYKIELWGSSGTGSKSYGAYTTGLIELKEGEILYFYTGKKNSGRESDVRLSSGGYNDEYSAATRIMVAAGGGSDEGASGGTLVGYTKRMNSLGGYIESLKTENFNLISPGPKNQDTNGTLVGFPKDYSVSYVKQPSPNTKTTPKATTHPNSIFGGGDGYYPSGFPDVGGISYIAGYGGSYTIDAGVVNVSPIYNNHEQTYDVESDDGGSVKYGSVTGRYWFYDGMMLPGVNNGAGKAKIERMVLKEEGKKLTRRNTKLNKVRYIKDCVFGTNNIKKMTAIKDGNDFVGKYNKTFTYTTEYLYGYSMSCAKVDLGGSNGYDLDEVAVFHESGIDYKYHVLRVSTNNYDWRDIIGISESPYSETTTEAGTRVSAYQFDATGDIPDQGNYYLMPVLSENKVVTAAESSDGSSNPLFLEKINGYRRQRWSIEKVGYGEYKIYELARYNAMTILQDENIVGNTIGADNIYNKYTRDDTQIWTIRSLGNGTYTISTILPSVDYKNTDNGNITVQSNPGNVENYNKIIIGKNNPITTRFKLISVDYSSSS